MITEKLKNTNFSDKENRNEFFEIIQKITKELPIIINAKTGKGIELVKEALIRKMPKDFETRSITGDFVKESVYTSLFDFPVLKVELHVRLKPSHKLQLFS